MNKKGLMIAVGILGVVLVAVMVVGVYYYIEGTKAPVSVEVKAPVRSTEDNELYEVKKDLDDTTLETADLDADINELNSLDLTGV